MSLATKLAGLRQIWRFDNRGFLLVQRLLFRRESLAIYRLGRLRVLVDHDAGDQSGAPEVITTRMYADHLAHLASKTPLTLLDLGANAGGFPLFLAHHGVPLARVVSVELNPRTCVRLRYNLERNLDCPVEVRNAALCGTPERFELALGEGGVGDSLYTTSFNSTGTTTVVMGETFDALFERYYGGQTIDICKIDVEFAEYDVLAHAGHECLRNCRLIVIEIHNKPGHSPREVADAIVAMGFDELPRGSDPDVYLFRRRDAARA